jgi:outer membrane immunogenic protein
MWCSRGLAAPLLIVKVVAGAEPRMHREHQNQPTVLFGLHAPAASHVHRGKRNGGVVMKALLQIGSLGVLLATPAFAADMPLKAPPPPAPVFSWTGFYVGAALGGEWADAKWTTTLFAVPPGAKSVTVDGSSPRNYDPSSLRAGGYVGYNWQWTPQWIGGVEADLAYANGRVSAAGIPGCAIACAAGSPGPGVDTSSVKLGWDASVRARLGYLITPNLLAYGTGGIAWQDTQISATCQHSGPDPLCLFLPALPFSTATDSAIRTGWTVGAGLESRIGGNWLLRAEYRYSYFGTWSNTLNLGVPGATPQIVNDQLKISTQIATLGVTYKFGSDAAQAAYK